jgi:hypothetical protein
LKVDQVMARIASTGPRRFANAAVVSLAFAIAIGLLSAGAGCNDRADPRVTQIQELEDRLAAQGRSLAAKDASLTEQAREIQRLRGLDDRGRYDRLVRVDRIDLERLSGLYDENSDGRPDGIVLYLRLFDADGDVLKAAGSARVSLFDLTLPEGQQLLARAEFTTDQMKQQWFGRLMTSHFTLRFPFGADCRQPSSSTVTALVQFTELLTGRTFEVQKSLPLAL